MQINTSRLPIHSHADQPYDGSETDEDRERDRGERHEKRVVSRLVPVTLQRAARVVHDRVVTEEDGRHGDDPQQWHRRHDDGAELEETEQTMKWEEITRWIPSLESMSEAPPHG